MCRFVRDKCKRAPKAPRGFTLANDPWPEGLTGTLQRMIRALIQSCGNPNYADGLLNKRDTPSLASALLSPALRVASFSLFSHPPLHSILPGPRENHPRHSLSLDALPHPQGMALADPPSRVSFRDGSRRWKSGDHDRRSPNLRSFHCRNLSPRTGAGGERGEA